MQELMEMLDETRGCHLHVIHDDINRIQLEAEGTPVQELMELLEVLP